MASELCSDCVDDEFLKTIVTDDGEPGECDVCGEDKPHTITIARLGELLEPILRRHYRQGSNHPTFSADDDDDSAYYEQEGEDLSFLVQEVLGQYFDCLDEIVDAVIGAEDCWPPDGDIPFWGRETNYVERRASGYEFHKTWKEVASDLAIHQRFFSSAAKQFFDDLFEDVDDFKSRTVDALGNANVVRTLPQNSILFRGRVLPSDEQMKPWFAEPYKHVGPPQSKFARSGRMNPDGVPVFYGSENVDTCLAELRPAIGGKTALIKLNTTGTLRLLDFTSMPTAYKSLSYFQSDFDSQVAKISFMKSLGVLISSPVVPGQETSYLITQVMAEYLSHVHPQPFDGVIFSSVQHAGGRNVVLFPRGKDTPTFPLHYVAHSISVYETSAITYTHTSLNYKLIDGELELDVEDFTDFEDS